MENRSFDHYFGTFPGADGFPRDAQGKIDVCLPDPDQPGICQRPYHDTNTIDQGGPHGEIASTIAIDGGKMDGFVRALEQIGNGCMKHPTSIRARQRTTGPTGSPTSWATTRRGDPELLGVREALHAARPHVRPDRLVDATRAPVPGVGVVGDVPRPERPDELYVGPEVPGRDLGERASSGSRRTADLARTSGATSRGCSTRTASAGRTTWGPGRACAAVRDTLRGSRPRRCRTRCPGSGRCRRPASSSDDPTEHGVLPRRRTGDLPSVSWVMPSDGPRRAPPDNIQDGHVLGHEDRERRDAGSAWESIRDLPHVGRLGRLLRSRGAAGGRRERLGLRVPSW